VHTHLDRVTHEAWANVRCCVLEDGMWFAVLIASERGEGDGENKCSPQLGARRQRKLIIEGSGPRARELYSRCVTTDVGSVL
jgi:hypothetical protein